MGAEIFHALKSLLSQAGHSTAVGDEGGFAPAINSSDEALDYITRSIETAGYAIGKDALIGLDAAATRTLARRRLSPCRRGAQPDV